MAERRPKFVLDSQPTSESISQINEMFEELYRLVGDAAGHNILSTLHTDTRIDPEQTTLLRGDILVAQRTPQGADVIRLQRFAVGAAATVLKTTDGIDVSYGKVVLTTDVSSVLPVANGGTNKSSYTAGSVVFAGASGTTLTEDNANFFWDDSNDRLGLGVAVPTVRLDVVNDGLATTLTPTLRLANTTAATSGVPRQFSPALVFSGFGWDTDGGGSSKLNRAAVYMRTVTGAVPSNYLAFAFENDAAGAFTDDIYMGRAIDGGAPDLRFRDGNLVFRNSSRGIYFTATPLTDNISGNFQNISAQSGGTIEVVTLGGSFSILGHTNGSTTIPTLDMRPFDAATNNAPILAIRLKAQPATTAAAGFGSRVLFQAYSNTTANQDQGTFDSVWSDATHATRSADFVMRLVDGAAAHAEKFRFASTGLATIPSINLTSGALGNISYGKYTPTRSAETNLDSNVTLTEAQYLRVGNTVTVSGRFTADPTAAATSTSFEMTLPVASNIGAAEDVAGTAFCGTIAGQGAAITGSVANDTAVVTWVSGDVASQTWSYTFTYEIL